MKKITTQRQIRLEILNEERFRKKIKRFGKTFANSRLSKLPAPKSPKEYSDFIVPEVLCLDSVFNESVIFFNSIRSQAMVTKTTIRLQFENCKLIRPSAMLLLLAEVHRARLLRGNNVLTGTYPKDTKLLRRMCDMGFFSMLGIKSPIESIRTFPMEYIKFRSGTQLDASSAKELRNSLLGARITMIPAARSKLQRGIVEAMLNAKQHAYPNDNNGLSYTQVQNRWWICGNYHRPSKRLSIMFCDLGVGIPRTLPRRYAIEHIRKLLSLVPGIRPDDGAMIYAGMTIGRTQTKLTHRGKGLNDLTKFIDQAGAGELKIYSRRGIYRYTSPSNDSFLTLDHAIGGTLIHWTVPIDKVTNWSGDENEQPEDD